MTTFDKSAQRARAAQADATALAAGAIIPKNPIPRPVVKPAQVAVFENKLVQVGDEVIHPTVSSNSVSLTRKKVTRIDNGVIYLDNSHQGVRVPKRLIKAS